MDENQAKVDTRSTLAVIVVLNLLGLTVWLGITRPESDQFTLLLGMLGGATTAVLGYYFGSTSSSDRKDVTQAKVAEKLALAAAAPVPEAPKFTWISLMSEEERVRLDDAAKIDGRAKTFIATSQVGRATVEDLDHLVAIGVLTEERAEQLQSANRPTPTT